MGWNLTGRLRAAQMVLISGCSLHRLHFAPSVARAHAPTPILRTHTRHAYRPRASLVNLLPRAVQMPREELKPHRGPGTTAAPAAASEQVASCAAAAPARRSLELYDGGVLVLTPLHLCMALGDGGRLAAHVLHTYPEVRAGATPMVQLHACTGRYFLLMWPASAVALPWFAGGQGFRPGHRVMTIACMQSCVLS